MNALQIPSKEYQLLNELKKFCNYTPDIRYPVGIGDDAAIRVCDDGEQLVFTGDTLVEGVHFSQDFMSFEEIGYKAMVSNISDCASMGATPDSALVQLVFPKKNNNKSEIQKIVIQLYNGFKKACEKWDFPIIGGDLSQGPCWVIAISFTGRKNAGCRLLKRTGSVFGDDLWVTGVPGKSAAGLDVLRKWGRKAYPEKYMSLVQAHVEPCARIDAGLKLVEDPAVHSMIDLSDGISKECHTLCYENNIGIELTNAIEIITPSMVNLARQLDKSVEDWYMYGGEDYELLFTTSCDFDASLYTDYCFYNIGSVINPENGVSICDQNGNKSPAEKYGWDHFQ